MRHHGMIGGIGILVLSACLSGATCAGSPAATTFRGAHRTAIAGMTLPATASGAWITLSPRAGLPGTVIRVSGFLPGGPSAAQAQKTISFNYGHVCWAACPGGLTYDGVPVQWSRTQAGADTGRTWRPVPVPTGYTMGEFSTFQVTGHVVQALFGRLPPKPDQAPALAVEQTTDGGRTWRPAHLACPASGPCVRWGAAPGPFSSMGVPTPQGIAYSADGGRTWKTPAWPSWVDLKYPGPNELVALSPTEVALLAGGSAYPFRLSYDGGRTWEVVALPALPGGMAGQFPGLQMLPDGALLAQTQSTGMPWWLLQPGTTHWCPVSGVALPAWPAALHVIDGRVWWLAGGRFGPGALALHSAPLSSLRCG